VGVTLSFPEFQGGAEDEIPGATALADRFGIHQHIRVVTKEEFLGDLPRILGDIDQPSIDGVNTWYASKAASEIGLKVVLSGVGGDELFQGYSHFRGLTRVIQAMRLVSALPGLAQVVDGLFRWQGRRSDNPRWAEFRNLGQSLPGAWLLRRGLFTMKEAAALAGLQGDVPDPIQLVLAMTGPLPRDHPLAVGQIESTTYLRNQLLRDSDWASMAHSLELRTPLVDAWLLKELAPHLPAFHSYPNKALLAGTTAEPLPNQVVHKRKTGFGMPIHRWLLGHPQLTRPETGSRGWAKVVAQTYSDLTERL